MWLSMVRAKKVPPIVAVLTVGKILMRHQKKTVFNITCVEPCKELCEENLVSDFSSNDGFK